MKLFRSIFPFSTTSEIPQDINERLSSVPFDGLTDGLREISGFALLTENERFIKADGRWLFKYVEQNRSANRQAVETLYQERLQKARDDGRVPDDDQQYAMWEQAERELIKYAPIRESVVFILFDAPAGRVWCAGSNVKKCEDALKGLRRALGGLKTVPLTFDAAGELLAAHISKDLARRHSNEMPDHLMIPAYAKTVAVDAENDQKVTFDGVDLDDESVREVIAPLIVRTIELQLVRRWPNGECDVLAWCTLHAPDKGNMHLKGFDYDGSAVGAEGDEDHLHATEMLLVSKYAGQIFDGIKSFIFGAAVEETA